MKTKVAIIGAGPAGLTAGYILSKEAVDVVVLEADPVYVGGISRTVTYKDFHFDIGGHRFFSKSKAVEDLWTEILPNDMLVRPRSSRIFYDGKFYSYPLKPVEALVKLGIVKSALCVLSWLKARLFPVRNPRNFEEWVSNQFGKRLFNTFFKSYTEKVWGMSCKEISADWAAQRIRGLSLGSAIKNALIPLITLAGLQLPLVFSGALVTETVFTWPGMGRLFVDSIGYRDYPVLMGLLMLTALLVVVGNLLTDFIYAAVDPRVRLA